LNIRITPVFLSKLMRMAAAGRAKGLAKPMVWLQKQG
jgi:hypothetical protein